MGYKVLRKNRVPNYLPDVLERAAELSAPSVKHIIVRHDDYCDIWRGEPCNCEPGVSEPLDEPPQYR